MAWKRVKPDRDKGVKLELASQLIRGKRYGVAPCYVAGQDAIVVKAGREKRIVNTRTQAREWLQARGLGYREAMMFISEGISLVIIKERLHELCKDGGAINCT